MGTSDSEYSENLRVEYQAAHDAYLHYDNYSWQVGSILIAGVFVFWGFILGSAEITSNLNFGKALVTFIMSIWYLYANHNRQIYRFKLFRIRQIEGLLGMEQHVNFLKWKI